MLWASATLEIGFLGWYAKDSMTAGDPPNKDAPATAPLLAPTALDRFVRLYPQMPLIAPFMTFLLLMSAESLFDDGHKPWLYAVRTFGALYVALLFRKYWPPLGKVHLPICIVVGLLVAFGWVAIHKWIVGFSWYGATQVLGKDPVPADFYIPDERLGTGLAYWAFLVVRIGGAATVVPIVEELFWRGFLLRFLIDRYDFDKIPLATFTWSSFLLCSVLSAAEHPQWEVGIACWIVYNLLFYWKKSLMCLMVTHGITNLALYVYVVIYRDWVFW